MILFDVGTGMIEAVCVFSSQIMEGSRNLAILLSSHGSVTSNRANMIMILKNASLASFKFYDSRIIFIIFVFVPLFCRSFLEIGH